MRDLVLVLHGPTVATDALVHTLAPLVIQSILWGGHVTIVGAECIHFRLFSNPTHTSSVWPQILRTLDRRVHPVGREGTELEGNAAVGCSNDDDDISDAKESLPDGEDWDSDDHEPNNGLGQLLTGDNDNAQPGGPNQPTGASFLDTGIRANLTAHLLRVIGLRAIPEVFRRKYRTQIEAFTPLAQIIASGWCFETYDDWVESLAPEDRQVEVERPRIPAEYLARRRTVANRRLTRLKMAHPVAFHKRQMRALALRHSRIVAARQVQQAAHEAQQANARQDGPQVAAAGA